MLLSTLYKNPTTPPSNNFKNERRPPFFSKMEEDLNYFLKMEDDLNFFQKCKTTSIFSKEKTIQIFWKMVDDFKARILDFAKP